VSYSDTYDSVCVLLEEYADADIETVATQLLSMIGLMGEDILDALDPPPGLQHWLTSHGLALVTTTEARSVRVWEAVESGGDEEENGDLEGETTSEKLPLQVGEFVEYRTAPHGPNGFQQIGAGWVADFDVDTDGETYYWVDPGDRPQIFVKPSEGDLIRRRVADDAP